MLKSILTFAAVSAVTPAFADTQKPAETVDPQLLIHLMERIENSGCDTNDKCDEVVRRTLHPQRIIEDLNYAEILLSLSGVGALITGEAKFHLKFTDEEKRLFNESPARGVQALYWGNEAYSEAQRRFLPTYLHNENGDAFRHCLWSSLLVGKIDYNWAAKWTFAHENGPEVVPIERSMDIHNNVEGMVAFEMTGISDYGSLRDTCLYNVDWGILRRIRGDSLVPTDSTGKL